MRGLAAIGRCSNTTRCTAISSNTVLQLLRSPQKSVFASPRAPGSFAVAIAPNRMHSKHFQKRFVMSNVPKRDDSEEEEDLAKHSSAANAEPQFSPLSTAYLTLPNVITITRMISSPAIGYLIVADKPMLACAATLAAAVSDWIDGHIAKRYNQQVKQA